MANNIDFITSLSKANDFEELVKRIVSHIYNAEAYIVNGPYDGGRDLIYKRMGKEVREPIQITIQENNLDAKILDDARKAHELAKNFDYPYVLTLFSSRKITASRKAKLKKSARDQYGISLEIYDATEIEQIISDDAPEILEFLIKTLHGYKANTNSIDAKARAFYDYLALSKDSAHLKWSILAQCRFVWNLTSSNIAGTAILKTKNP